MFRCKKASSFHASLQNSKPEVEMQAWTIKYFTSAGRTEILKQRLGDDQGLFNGVTRCVLTEVSHFVWIVRSNQPLNEIILTDTCVTCTKPLGCQEMLFLVFEIHELALIVYSIVLSHLQLMLPSFRLQSQHHS
jgi:hypothetical protein